MPKGKKFDAAEKHFLEKEQRLAREIKASQEQCADLRKQCTDLSEHLQAAQAENAQLHDWIDRLLEYTELSQDDIRAACEKDKAIGSVMKAFNRMSRGF